MKKIIRDSYRRTRGGHTVIYKLSCSSCKLPLFAYQKDGIGTILRLYIDRITENYATIKFESTRVSCPGCGNLIGTISTYKKEDRPAIFLARGSVSKVKA